MAMRNNRRFAAAMNAPQDDGPPLTDPEVVALYGAVRVALVEGRNDGGDPLLAIARLGEMTKAGHLEACLAVAKLWFANAELRSRRRRVRGIR